MPFKTAIVGILLSTDMPRDLMAKTITQANKRLDLGDTLDSTGVIIIPVNPDVVSFNVCLKVYPGGEDALARFKAYADKISVGDEAGYEFDNETSDYMVSLGAKHRAEIEAAQTP